ncbi:serine hydrolase [Clostridium sp. DL1XJH146]
MRKSLTFFMTILLVLTTSVLPAYAENDYKLSEISADGIVLMDANTGQILYSKNPDAQYPPASTTKIMTALLALENCDLDEIVKVGDEPPYADGSKIYINEGEKIPLKDLLYSLLLVSANDSAEAIAEHISGSVEDFAILMNKRAKELGCTNTNFVNPHGLYDDNHRTTAHDLALILRELYSHPEFSEIATTSMYYIEPTNKQEEQRPLWNGNRLIQQSSPYYYEWCQGGKTGYTVQSKHSYVATAKKDSVSLVAVLLHDEQKTFWTDSKNLFNYGFDTFEAINYKKSGDIISTYKISDEKTIDLVALNDFTYLSKIGSTSEPQISITNKDLSQSSFAANEEILTANVTIDDEIVGELKLGSNEDYSYEKSVIPKSEETDNTNNSISVATILKYVGLALVLAIVLLRIRKRIRDKNRKKKLEALKKKNIYLSKYKNRF